MTTPRKIALHPLDGHPGVTVAALHAPGSVSGTYAVQLDRGVSVGRHAHPNAETIVAYGSLHVTVGEDLHELDRGDAIDIPPGVEHSVTNPLARPVDYISVATPPWEGTSAMLVPASVVEAMGDAQDDAEDCFDVAGAAASRSEFDTHYSRIMDAVSVAANGLRALALLTGGSI